MLEYQAATAEILQIIGGAGINVDSLLRLWTARALLTLSEWLAMPVAGKR